MSDYLLKALAYDEKVRIYVVNTKDCLTSLCKNINYYPSALAAVGRVLTATVMMGSMLKLEETITVRINGDGPIGHIIADSDAHGHVRAYGANPFCHYEYNDSKKLNVKATVGENGVLSVIKDLKLKEPFIGSVELISGEIAEDFAYYFMMSEQIPSAVSLGVLVDEFNKPLRSGGFIIQLLPNTPEEVIAILEKKIKEIPPMTEILEQGFSLEDIVKMIGDDDVQIIEILPVSFECKCSKERFARGILSLGIDEIKDMIDRDNQAETTCQFCGAKYFFSKNELDDIYDEALINMNKKN